MAKSLAGSDTALLKLIPSLRGAKDPLAELEKTFAGAAKAAGDADPYLRLSIAFGEIQESIGRQVLPVLESFADYMIDLTPKVQAFFDNLNDPTTPTGKSWGNLNKAVSTFGDTWTGVEGKVTGSGIFTFLVDGVTNVINMFNAMGTVISSQLEGAKKFLQLDFAGGQNAINKGLEDAARITGGTTNIPGTIGYKAPARPTVASNPKPNVTLNVKATQSAQQITQTLTKGTTSSGININSLISGGGKIR
jgi:hypothetical protein